MCNSGTCPYEINSGPDWGDCEKKPNQVCPESYETYEEAEAAMQAAQDEAKLWKVLNKS